MAYSSLNFGQQLHEHEYTEIKNKIRLYEKTNKRIYLANYGILLMLNHIFIKIYMIKKNAIIC